MRIPLLLIPTALLLPMVSTVCAAVDFEKDIRPILETNCVRCHNPKGTDVEEGRTDVELQTKEQAFEVVSTIVPGKPEKSKIYTTTTLPDDAKKLMPPKNKVTGALSRLPKEQTDTIKKWIEEGANWPADAKPLVARKAPSEIGTSGGEQAIVDEISK